MFEKRIHIALILLAILLSTITSSAWAAVSRTVGGDDCNPVVTVTVTPDAGVSAWAYEERLYGLEASSITGDGVWSDNPGVIRWGAFLSDEAMSFSYTLSGFDGSYSISGVESHDGVDSDSGSATVVIDCEPPPLVLVSTPVFDPAGGAVVPVTVIISTATGGAVIHYTTDGTIPTTSSPVYTDPIDIDDLTILQAMAVKAGMEDSAAAKAVFQKPWEPPALTLERVLGGTGCRPVVSVSVTPGVGTSAYAVEEILAPDLEPENISDGGSWDETAGAVRWGVFLDGESRVLSYELVGSDGSYSLGGEGCFDGRCQDVSGSKQVSIDCTPEKAATPVLDPASGTRAPVTVSMSTETAGAEIRYTLDGSEPDEFSTLYSGPVLLEDGATVRARALKSGLDPSDAAWAVYPPARRPMAIIVAGGGPFTGNDLWPATRLVSNYAYLALLYQGYAKDDIQFLSHDILVDVDGNEEMDDIDAEATRANLEEAVTVWAKDADEVLLYLTDHGGDQTFMLGETDILDAEELDGWLDNLQAEMEGRVSVLYDACQAGTFVPIVTPPPGKERVVVTSVNNEPALFLEGGLISFSYQFWTSIFLNGKLYDGYLIGRNSVWNRQASLLDANGNGIANEDEDKDNARHIVIGRGASAGSTPPEIRSFPGEQLLNGGTSAVIWASDILSTDPLNRVWAVIIPPDYHPGAANIPVTDFPTLEMTDPDGDGTYEGVYDGFTLHGVYRLMIYARSAQGLLGPPGETTVVQNGGVIPPNNEPETEDVTLETDEDVLIQGILPGSDADGDDLNFIIVENGAIGTVMISNVETGAFFYQPHGDKHGSDSFTFKVNDGAVDSAIGTASITIHPVEDAPRPVDMHLGAVRNTDASGTLNASDPEGDPVTFAIGVGPDHGDVVSLDAGSGAFTYRPDPGYFGPDAFTFSADDGKTTPSEGEVSITIDRGFNTPPAAIDTAISGDEDIPFSGVLQGNDADGDPLTFILVTAAGEGDVEITDPGAGEVMYSPYENVNGEDSFTFKVSDGMEESDPATCTVSITPVNDAPTAVDGQLSVNSLSGAGGFLNALDVETDPLVFSIAENGSMGQAVITDPAAGSYTYTPSTSENGGDLFTFTVSDGQDASAPATVTVNIRLPQAEIIRSFSGDGCTVEASVSVTSVDTVKAYAVEEILPPGLTPSDISDDGVWDEASRTIRWGVFLDNAVRVLTYRFTGDDGAYDISGTGSFDGWDQEIAGDAHASVSCVVQRVAAPVFDPPSGAKVPVDATITTETADAEIRYTTNGEEPGPDSLPYTAPLHFDESVVVKARAYKAGMYESPVAWAKYRPSKTPKAIIVAGGGPYSGNSLWPATRMISEYGYRALLYQGYDKEDILFLCDDPDVDADGNGDFDDVSGPVDSQTLREAIQTWALDAESLLLFMTDHGGPAKFRLNADEILDASDLDDWLDGLQGTMDGMVMTVYDACSSGTFVEPLTPPPGKKRVLITSASDEWAWFMQRGKVSFSYQFWASVYASGRLYSAYDNAGRTMAEFQTALLDADGDGTPGEDEDRLAAMDIVLGRGAASAAVAPRIGSASSPRVLGDETSATIQAGDITTLNGIQRVWAVVVPPNFGPDAPDEPVLDAPEVDLVDPDGDGVFSGAYDGFTSDGVYRIVVFAVDSQGLYSPPIHTMFSKNAPLPDDYEDDDAWDRAGVIFLNDADSRRHNFHDAGDVDWVQFYGLKDVLYTIDASNLGANADVVVELYHGFDWSNPIRTTDDYGYGGDETLDWISAADGVIRVMVRHALPEVFGRDTQYDLRVFRHITSFHGWIEGVATNAAGAPVEGAFIHTDGGGSAISLADGVYWLAHQPGTFSIEARAGGYAPASHSIVVSESQTVTRNFVLTPLVSPPSSPIDPSPADGAMNSLLNTVVSWSDGGGAVSYDVYFGTDPTPDGDEFRGNRNSPAYDPGPLDCGATYYWRIDARNANGVAAGDVWTFTTETPAAIPDFSATPLSGDAPLSVQFTDLSMYNPTSWAWDFNDDGVVDSTERHPLHTYAVADTYSVTLTVSNGGDPAETTRLNYIEVWGCGYLPVRIPGPSTDYYWTVQEAYDDAVDGDVIECHGGDFPGGFVADDAKDVAIRSGRDCEYANASGPTTIQGAMTISDGAVVLDDGALVVGP